MLSQEPVTVEDKILHLRNFPVDLHSQLKSKAALEGVPMRDLVIEVLRKAVLSDKNAETR